MCDSVTINLDKRRPVRYVKGGSLFDKQDVVQRIDFLDKNRFLIAKYESQVSFCFNGNESSEHEIDEGESLIGFYGVKDK